MATNKDLVILKLAWLQQEVQKGKTGPQKILQEFYFQSSFKNINSPLTPF